MPIIVVSLYQASQEFAHWPFLQLTLLEVDQVLVQLILYPIQDEWTVMKYSICVHHNSTIKDLLKSKDPNKDEMLKGVVANKKEDKESDHKKERSVVPNNNDGQGDMESSSQLDSEAFDNDREQEEEKRVSLINLRRTHNLAM
eukprot:4228474-Ditylum_brightwellii.AAC.1